MYRYSKSLLLFRNLTLALVLTLGVQQCASFDLSLFKKRPSAKLQDVDIKSISFQDITLVFDIAITNPYPLGIKINKVDMQFLVENRNFFKTATGQGLRLKARGTASTKLIVAFKYKDLERVVRYYRSRDYLQTDIKGNIVLDLPKVGIPSFPKTWSIPFKVGKKIPAIKPTIRIKNFKVKQPTKAEVAAALRKAKKKILNPANVAGMFGDLLRGKRNKAAQRLNPQDLDLKLKVSFDIELKNNTRASISFRKLNYTFFIQNQSIVTGNTSNIRKYGKTLILRVNNEFSSRALGKSVLQAFRSRKANFKLSGNTAIQLPASIKKGPLPLVINESGTFRF